MCGVAVQPNLHVRHLEAGLDIASATGLTDAFHRHVHDRYVLGVTTAGVQSFWYRGSQCRALPGQAFAMHPGETHDGRPGGDGSYGYQAVYIAPDLLAEALDSPREPFVREAVGRHPALVAALNDLFATGSSPVDDVAMADCLARLADAMNTLSDCARKLPGSVDWHTAKRIREDVLAHLGQGRSMADLEQEHGMSRFAITRLFRRCFGVGPHQFLVYQRVSKARSLIFRGATLADAAAVSGFADQSHMTRLFVKTTGLSPGKWRKLSVGSGTN